MRDTRAAIPPEIRARRGRAMVRRLFALPEVRDAHTVLLFSSFGSEVPTKEIADRLLREGRRVLLPFMQEGKMHAAELRRTEVPIPTAYGPEEPPDRTPVSPHEVDVVIAPGLAFDREGFRLGYGGGHYDRFLSQARADAHRIGVAFQEQVIEHVPHGRGDERMDLLVTDRETVRCRPNRLPEPE